MGSQRFPRQDDVCAELAYRYPLDGYDALGQLLVTMISTGLARRRHARQRRRELRLLDAAYALPAYERAA